MALARSRAGSVLAGLLLVATGCTDGATSAGPEDSTPPTDGRMTSRSATAGPLATPPGLRLGPATAPVDTPVPAVFVGASAVVTSAGTDDVGLVFEGGPPACVARYVDPPITDAVSGDPVKVAGTAFLQLRCRPVTGVHIGYVSERDAPFTLRSGTDRFRNANTRNVIEAVQTGYDGSVLTWTIGLRHKAPMGLGVIEGDRSGPVVVVAQ